MFTYTFQDNGLSRGIAGLVEATGLNARIVLRKETGELEKTLVRITPPADPAKTRENIKRDITGKFNIVADEANSNMIRSGGSFSATGVHWYRVDPLYLRGIAPKADKRDASVDELEVLRHQITKKGRLSLPFVHPRRRQRVLLYQTITTKASTVNKLIARARSHVGRLKAGWLAAVEFGVIQLTGSNLPPQWVTRHQSGARGAFVDGLSNPKNPTFTITNYGRGINQRAVPGLIADAVKIRAEAMRKNALLFLQNRKRVSDYAK